MEIIRDHPNLSCNLKGEFYIYQNCFVAESLTMTVLKKYLVYHIICQVSNLKVFDEDLSLSFPTVLGEITKQILIPKSEISSKLTIEEVIQFAQDCNKPSNYQKLKERLLILKKYQPLGIYYSQLYRENPELQTKL